MNHKIIKKRRKSKHYVNNEKLYNDIVEYQKAVKHAEIENLEKPRLPESIGKAVYDIAVNVSKMNSVRNYPFIEEMISDRL